MLIAITESSASKKLNFPSRSATKIKKAEPAKKGKSTWINSKLIFIFLPTIPTSPKIRKMLVMLDPKTLPITISEEFFRTAIIEETSSGREVPIATIVTPVIKEGMPINFPIFSEALVK